MLRIPLNLGFERSSAIVSAAIVCLRRLGSHRQSPGNDRTRIGAVRKATVRYESGRDHPRADRPALKPSGCCTASGTQGVCIKLCLRSRLQNGVGPVIARRDLLCVAVCCLCLQTSAAVAQERSHTGHGILHADELERLDSGTVRMDLNAIRFNPALLEQKPVMQYFIALNNCNDRAVERALKNELDYPALANFYGAKATEILSGLPDTIGLLLFRGNTKGEVIWGKSTGGYDPTLKTLALGEYDTDRKTFPISVSDKSKSFEVAGTQQVGIDFGSLAKSCPVAYSSMLPRASAGLPLSYSVTIKPLSFHELPMSEADARKYIESVNSSQRGIVLAVDFHVTPNVQKTSEKEMAFTGTIARITVLNASSFQKVGVLYDDSSLAPAQTKSIPSAITTMKSPREFNAEVLTAVYVSLAADACGWPLSPQQKANLKRYRSDIDTYGKFDDKYYMNSLIGRIRNSINNPAVGFCESATERQDFDRRAATVWPKGPMAAPAPSIK